VCARFIRAPACSWWTVFPMNSSLACQLYCLYTTVTLHPNTSAEVISTVIKVFLMFIILWTNEISQWKQFTTSWELRFAMHICNVSLFVSWLGYCVKNMTFKKNYQAPLRNPLILQHSCHFQNLVSCLCHGSGCVTSSSLLFVLVLSFAAVC